MSLSALETFLLISMHDGNWCRKSRSAIPRLSPVKQPHQKQQHLAQACCIHVVCIILHLVVHGNAGFQRLKLATVSDGECQETQGLQV